MGLGVTALIQKDNSPTSLQLEAVDQVFVNVKNTIIEEYKQASWLSQELRNFIIQKVNI